jgi:hypothetical protein
MQKGRAVLNLFHVVVRQQSLTSPSPATHLRSHGIVGPASETAEPGTFMSTVFGPACAPAQVEER